MLAVVLALGAGAAWGVGDFLGGIGSRRHGVFSVLLVSYWVGFAGVLVWALTSGDAPPSAGAVAAAGGAAIGGFVGLAALYQGFARGAMGIVAPISATAPAVPLAVDVARGDTPSTLQLAGIALALAGIVAVSREPVSSGGRVASGAGLAVVAALAFGLYFVGIEHAAEQSVPWAIAISRGTSALLVLAVVARRPRAFGLPRRAVPLAGVIGIFDTGANVLLATAITHGLLSVVAVLASLYPIVTVALAHVLLRERLAGTQWAGAGGALGGAALIAAG